MPMKLHLSGLLVVALLTAGCGGSSANDSNGNSSSANSGSSSLSSSSVSSISSSLASSSTASVSSVTSSSASSVASSIGSGASSSASSNSSASSGVSTGTSSSASSISHASFKAVPPSGVVGQEWVNGESRLIKDNNASGSGQIVGFLWNNNDANIYMFTSSNNGVSWSAVGSLSMGSNGYSAPSQIKAITQDASGKIHAIARAQNLSMYYLRLNLTYSSGVISGVTSEAAIQIPSHSAMGNEVRADIKIVKNAAGADTLVYLVDLSIVHGGDEHVYMSRATTLTPTAASQFVGLNDSTQGDTVVFSDSSGTMSTHNHTALFAQNELSKDLYVFEGGIDGDYGAGNDTLRGIRLTNSSAGWSVGAQTTIATSGTYQAELFSAASGASHAWVMYESPSKGVTFGYFDSAGNYNDAVITSPDSTQNRNGWGVFSVSSDESKVWAIWDTMDYGNNTTSLKAYEGYWNGSSWTKYTDSGASDSMGMATISGWQDGVCGLLFNGLVGIQSNYQPTAACVWGQ